MPDRTQLRGTGYLLAGQSTYIGTITYSIMLIEYTNDTIHIRGQFHFTTAPRDISSYPALVIQLENSFYVGIALKHQDPQQNIYAFTEQRPPVTPLA